MAALGNTVAAAYSRIFPNTKPHKKEVFAGANVAGPTTFHGLAASAATGALDPATFVLQMKMLDELDNYYLNKIIDKVEEYEQEKQLQKGFGQLIRNYSLSAKLGPYLTVADYLPFWLDMKHTSILFRGTYSPLYSKDIWDPSFKSVIATSSDPRMADLFALKTFSNISSYAEYTGHLYILLVAPGVKYIDVKKQAILPSVPKYLVHHYLPILKPLVGPTIHEEDEYVLLSNPNVKIIFDSEIIPIASNEEHNTKIIPLFDYIIKQVLRKDRAGPIHSALNRIPPVTFKENPHLSPINIEGLFDSENGPVRYMQIHIALYGFDGVVGGSRSVHVSSAPDGSNMIYGDQPNGLRIKNKLWVKISPMMMLNATYGMESEEAMGMTSIATEGGGGAVGGAGMGMTSIATEGGGGAVGGAGMGMTSAVGAVGGAGMGMTSATGAVGGAGMGMTNTNKGNGEEVSNHTTVGETNKRNTRKQSTKNGPKKTFNKNIGKYRNAKRAETAGRLTVKRKEIASIKKRGIKT